MSGEPDFRTLEAKLNSETQRRVSEGRASEVSALEGEELDPDLADLLTEKASKLEQYKMVTQHARNYFSELGERNTMKRYSIIV